MYQPAPSEETFEDTINVIREAKNDYNQNAPPMILWDKMLELLYSGHESVAWRLHERAWQPHFGDRTEWAKKFEEQLSESKYWKHLYPLQTWDSPSAEYPERLSHPIYPPSQEMPFQKAYEAQCGSVVTCDSDGCSAFSNELYPNELTYYPTNKTTPVHVLIILTNKGQPRIYNLWGTYGKLCNQHGSSCGGALDAPCDIGTQAFIIHKSNRQVPIQ